MSKIYLATDSSPVDIGTYELCSDVMDVVLDMSSIYGNQENISLQVNSEESVSIIKLNNGQLYLRPVNSHLVIVALIREDALDKQGLIDYNIRIICKSFIELFDTI
jgi:Ras-related GTP-binding protein C/D